MSGVFRCCETRYVVRMIAWADPGYPVHALMQDGNDTRLRSFRMQVENIVMLAAGDVHMGILI